MTITCEDGRTFTHALDVPKGDPRDPMTIDDLSVKFNALAEPIMSEGRRNELRDAVFAVDTMNDVGELMKLCAADV